MQSEETLRKLCVLDRELIENRIHALLEMRSAGNLRGMLEYVADDIQFSVKGSWAAFPFTSPVRGKKMVAQALSMIAVQFENLGSDVHELIIDGDRAAMRRTAKIRHRGTGHVAEIEIADFIRFRDGLVVEFSEITDSVALTRLEEG